MSVIYLVTSGHYSDYRFHCAFTDSATADEYVRLKNEAKGDYFYDKFSVEMCTLDEKDDLSFVKTGKQWWKVILYREERPAYAFTESIVPEDKEDRLSDTGIFTTRVYCKEKDRAIKVAQERLMMHRARLEGIG